MEQEKFTNLTIGLILGVLLMLVLEFFFADNPKREMELKFEQAKIDYLNRCNTSGGMDIIRDDEMKKIQKERMRSDKLRTMSNNIALGVAAGAVAGSRGHCHH